MHAAVAPSGAGQRAGAEYQAEEADAEQLDRHRFRVSAKA
jgi:hypothetical protein